MPEKSKSKSKAPPKKPKVPKFTSEFDVTIEDLASPSVIITDPKEVEKIVEDACESGHVVRVRSTHTPI